MANGGESGFILSIPSRRDQDEDQNPYTQIALGLVFLVGGIVMGLTVTFWITFGMMFPAAALIGNGVSQLKGNGVSQLNQQRQSQPEPVSKERELLSALRDNGNRSTPAEAAMQTSLTVEEADALLSKLAAGGHLMVESHAGALIYKLPASHDPELEEQS